MRTMDLSRLLQRDASRRLRITYIQMAAATRDHISNVTVYGLKFIFL